MTEFLTPENARKQAEQRKTEIEEYVYEVCDATRDILIGAIKGAIEKGKTEVSLVTRGYQIEECGGRIQKFLEQEGYENVLVEETGYTCFDNYRGQTQIVFSF